MTADEMPDWQRRLSIVRQRHPELSDRELAKSSGLSHTTVTNILTGIHLNPQRETLVKLVFALTMKPNERESVLGAFDTLVGGARMAAFDARHPGVRQEQSVMLDPNAQIIADAIGDLTDAVRKLTEVVILMGKGDSE